jgi:hypothetical protein
MGGLTNVSEVARTRFQQNLWKCVWATQKYPVMASSKTGFITSKNQNYPISFSGSTPNGISLKLVKYFIGYV